MPKNNGSSLEGTSFVVGFMQNELVERGYTPRLQLFICSRFDAAVTIEYPGGWVAYRSIPADSILVENVGPQLMSSKSEVIDLKSIFIKSDVPIVVYALNTLATSTDSYSAIPIKHLGKSYLTFNKQNDRYGLNANIQDATDTMARASEFMILAVEDGTFVDIIPTQLTERGFSRTRPISTALNRGQSYLVKSSNARNQNGDLTGSRITSNKPIAVLSGHVRAGLPAGPAASKDHLAEMLTPVEKWGKSYVSTKFAVASFLDIIRVMVAEDDTWVDIMTNTGVNSQYFAKAGDYREFSASKPTYYSSSKNFAVAQYMQSSSTAPGANKIYDPALVILPATNQFVSSALFQFPILDSQSIQNGQQVFSYYVNVIADSIALPSLTLNNVLVSTMAPQILTQRVPGTPLYWTQLSLPLGKTYLMRSDTGTFSGVMYGTSNYDSYANLFGMSFEPPSKTDETPPKYALNYNCGVVSGIIRDYSSETPYLSDVSVQTKQSYNYNWSISNELDTFGTRQIDANVKDLSRDGQLVIHSYDNKGNGREWSVFYDAPSYTATKKAIFPMQMGVEICSTIVIRNTDKTPMVINRVSINGALEYSLKNAPTADIIVAPDDSVSLLVCYTAVKPPTNSKGTVEVRFACGLTHSIPVENELSPLITLTDLDFGSVRIGDTACGVIKISSEGTQTAYIESIHPAIDYTSEFFYDLSGIIFPIELKPGESIDLSVCFAPDYQKAYFKLDTVYSSAGNVQYRFSGRGVRPQVESIVIDWGKRRVGTVSDTFALIWNNGDDKCIIDCGKIGNSSPVFTTPDFCSPSATINVNQASTSKISFQPNREGIFEWKLPVLVDWKFHDTVWVTLRGEGTLPLLRTQMIDMGSVVIFSRKDSVAEFFRLDGTEALDITSVVQTGPNSNMFELPVALFGVKRLDVNDIITGTATFAPTAVGPFLTEIELRHKGLPGFAETIDKVIVKGMGIPIDTMGIKASLDADLVVNACVVNDAKVEVVNTGNIPLVVNSIVVLFDGKNISVSTAADTIAVGSKNIYTFSFIADRTSGSNFVVKIQYADSLELVIPHSFDINYFKPTITAEHPNSIGAGTPVELRMHVSQTRSYDTPDEFVLDLNIDDTRFELTSVTADVNVSDALYSNEVRKCQLVKSKNNVRMLLGRLVQAPYAVDIKFSGTALWRTPDATQFYIKKPPSSCESETTENGEMLIDLCAAPLRVIKFGSFGLVTGNLVSEIADNLVELELNSTINTPISISATSVFGKKIDVVHKYSLQKGYQRCNFSCSSWATGLYLLEIQHQSGVIHASVLIVH
ncbi:MAG: choice-of-anchor D domain-containing protein [Ignavibacteria bacterium]|nr:choice-of-anchor D domain-containing protein [Ignavibacteria bacterium]